MNSSCLILKIGKRTAKQNIMLINIIVICSSIVLTSKVLDLMCVKLWVRTCYVYVFYRDRRTSWLDVEISLTT